MLVKYPDKVKHITGDRSKPFYHVTRANVVKRVKGYYNYLIRVIFLPHKPLYIQFYIRELTMRIGMMMIRRRRRKRRKGVALLKRMRAVVAAWWKVIARKDPLLR